MKVEPIHITIILSAIPGLTIWVFLVLKFKIWKKFMDTFKEGLPFERALEALKQGKSIRRKRSSYGLTKMVVSIRGNDKEKYCEFDIERKDRMRDNPVFGIDDILATDWMIED